MAGVKQRPLSDIGPQADTQEHESQTRKSANVRYRFLGLMRSTGKPVEGHVEADSEEWAFHALANNGIITESMKKDPIAAPTPAPQPLTTRAEPLLGPYQSTPAALAPAAPSLPTPSTLSNPAATRAANPPGTFAVGGSTTVPAAQAPAAGGAPA